MRKFDISLIGRRRVRPVSGNSRWLDSKLGGQNLRGGGIKVARQDPRQDRLISRKGGEALGKATGGNPHFHNNTLSTYTAHCPFVHCNFHLVNIVLPEGPIQFKIVHIQCTFTFIHIYFGATEIQIEIFFLYFAVWKKYLAVLFVKKIFKRNIPKQFPNIISQTGIFQNNF